MRTEAFVSFQLNGFDPYYNIFVLNHVLHRQFMYIENFVVFVIFYVFKIILCASFCVSALLNTIVFCC